MLITIYYLFWTEGYKEPSDDIGFQSPAECISGAWTGNLLIQSSCAIPLCHSPICEGGTSSCIWLICFTSLKIFLSDIKCRFHSSPCAQFLKYFWHITIIFSLLSLFIIYYVMYQFILVKPMGLVSYTIADLWLWCSQFYSCVIIFILWPWSLLNNDLLYFGNF